MKKPDQCFSFLDLENFLCEKIGKEYYGISGALQGHFKGKNVDKEVYEIVRVIKEWNSKNK